jgi:hypothetical protein
MNKIEFFEGDYHFLSNFYLCRVKFEGHFYDSSEHAFQAAKSLDDKVRWKFRQNIKPFEAKRLGKKVKLRPDWEKIKLSIMEDVVRDKFTRHADLRTKLIETGDAELIEGNTHGDAFWGRVNRSGHNHLGRILVRIRAEL